MRVRVLGQIEAIGDRSLAIGGPTQRRILGVLALHHDDVVSVDHLVDVTWPGDDRPERADRNVRSYVHRLRSSLGDGGALISTVGAGYRMHLDDDELDLERFEHAASRSRRLAEAGDTAAAMDAIAEAEELWRGDPFGEFSDEQWALGEATRLIETHLALLELRVELLIEAGRPDEAVAEVDALVRGHPYREHPRALQMRALYHAGRQVEALRAFQDFRRRLISDVGVEPTAELVDLDRRIAAGDESLGDTLHAHSVGSYVLGPRIGEGAFAVVYRATQPALGREVAIKIVRAELANRPEFVRRFASEAQMVARIEHPGVVPLYDYWREPDRAYLVMQLMSGGSLEERLDDGPLDLADAVSIVDQVASALGAAHEVGVVHRDVKPENVMFDAGGRAYLADFGIALEAADVADPEAALSEGSPLYASPEQLRKEAVGPEADVHALAFVAYAMLTGHAPFADSPDESTLLRRQLEEMIPSLRAARPDVPDAVDDVLARAAAKRPEDRYPSAESFALALSAAATGSTQVEGLTARARGNPYKGLQAFEESDAEVFHGRRRLVDELVEVLVRPGVNVLVVVGPSGSGKSSVVRAGLLPAIRDGVVPGSEGWFVTTMTPGAHPYEALETAMLRVAVNPPGSLLDQLQGHPRGILRAARRILPDDGTDLLLVIDQFEELYTTDIDPAERDGFLDALVTAASEHDTPVHVVITLRADFFDRPLRHAGFSAVIKHRTVTVTPLAPDELEQVIVDPAASAGVGFEPGVVSRIVADVNTEPGALPLLQYALTRTFDRCDGATIRALDYDDVGGLTGALAQRAEELWQDAGPDEQRAVRRLFGRLIALGEGTQDTRRRATRAELGDDEATSAAIDRYGTARLLTFDSDPATRAPTVEVAHEAVIREWPRLGAWLDEDRDALRAHRHLTSATRGWIERDRDPNELYRGARLETAVALADSGVVALDADERGFVHASLAQHDAEIAEAYQRSVRQRRFAIAAGILAVLALIAGVVAFVQREQAQDNARAIDVERLMAQAQVAAAEDPSLGLLTALEAYQLDPGTDTLGAVVSAATISPHDWLGDITTGRPQERLAFLPDGSLLSSSEEQLQVWDADARQLLRERPFGEQVIDLDVSTDGRAAAVAGAGEAGNWQVIDPVTLDTIAEGSVDGFITVIRIDGDGIVAVGRDNGSVEVIDIADPASPQRWAIDAHGEEPEGIIDVAVRPDGGAVAVARGHGEPVQQYEIDGGIGPGRPLDGSVAARYLAYDEDVLYTYWTTVNRYDAFTGDRIGDPVVRGKGADEGTRIVPAEGPTIHAVGAGVFETIDFETGTVDTRELLGPAAVPFGGAISPDAAVVVLGAMDGLSFWATDSAGLFVDTVVAAPDDGQFRQFHAITSDGTIVVQGGNASDSVSAYVIDVSTAEPTVLHEEPPGRAIRVGGDDVTTHGLLEDEGDATRIAIEHWDPEAGVMRPLIVVDRATFGQHIPLFTPDGSQYVHTWVTTDGIVDVWDVETGEQIARLPDLGDASDRQAFANVPVLTPDGSRVVVPSSDGHVAIYEVGSWELVELLEPEEGFRQMAYPGDGTKAFVESERGLEVRDPDDLTTVLQGPVPVDATEVGHNLQVTDDGRYLKTNGTSGAQLWEASTLTPIGRPFPHESGHWTATLATETNQLATVVEGATVVWDIEVDEWIDLACLAAGRNLTHEEWDELDLGGDYHVTCNRWPAA